MIDEQHRKMIGAITLRWNRLIRWLADERLAQERAKLKARQ